MTSIEKWDVAFYDQKELTGKRVKQTTSQLDYKWGTASLASGIPSNAFSANFDAKNYIYVGQDMLYEMRWNRYRLGR